MLELEPLADKWRSFNWAVREVDGHNVAALKQVLTEVPFENGKPNLIICHTTKGMGIDFIERDLSWHHKNKLTDAEICSLYEALEVQG